MKLLRSVRRRRLSDAVALRSASLAVSGDEARHSQLQALNIEWARIASEVPYYRDRVAAGELPRSFASLGEFAAAVPATNRAAARADMHRRSSDVRPADYYRTTGGTTAEPIQIPAWNSERVSTRPDIWVARGWYGVDAGSRLFLLWGHSHLLGSGLRGRVNALKRQALDRALGYYRYSAYDLDAAALRKAADAIVSFRPDYVLGYSVALDLFRRANENRAEDLQRAGVRVVVGAAEGFPEKGSAASLSALFGAPVAMEYGSVETDLIAHTHPEGGYRVMWRSYLVEAGPADSAGGRPVRVTSLYPRCFPLVRYELGDAIRTEAECDGTSVLRFEEVYGRSNDYVALRDGSMIHSEAFTHAVRSCPEVDAYQVVERATEPRLRVVAHSGLGEDVIAAIRGRLSRVHPLLADMPIDRVERLEQTRAGKTPMILRYSAAPARPNLRKH